MAGSLSLAYMGTTVILSPLINAKPDHNLSLGVVQKEGIKGKLFVCKRWKKVRDRLEFNDISSSDASNLNTWWENKYQLTYTRDTGSPETTYQVMLMNDGAPTDWMPGTAPGTKFQGALLIWEI